MGFEIPGSEADDLQFLRRENPLVMAPGAGLVTEDTLITEARLRALGEVQVDEDEPRFRLPLLEGARTLEASLGGEAQVVVLGSVASAKSWRRSSPSSAHACSFPARSSAAAT